jgi:hypothetical protein
VEPKSLKPRTNRRSKTLSLLQTTSYKPGDDVTHSWQATNTLSTAPHMGIIASRSPSPGASPVTYLGGGRKDAFNSCAVQCNTMESFLFGHCKFSLSQ